MKTRKENKIKKAALILVLAKLLSSADIVDAKANDHNQVYYYYFDENGRIVVVDDVNQMLNQGKTFIQNGEMISIFDLDNVYSKQFGGSQMVFDNNFDNLIKDPYIWEEMQNCFPISMFSSKEQALDFYELYFKTIYRSGCGYAAMADKVFQTFEQNEKEFENIFGFPMYTIRKDNSIDFNYEVMMLKMCNFSILYPDYDENKKEEFIGRYAKSLAKMELIRFMVSDEYKSKKTFGELKEEGLSEDELLEYVEKYKEVNQKYQELHDRWENSKDDIVSVGIGNHNDYGYIQEFLKGYGLKVKMNVEMISDNDYQPGDIIASNKYTLCKRDENGNKYSKQKKTGSHCVYVVSADEEAIIVSSWGDRYEYDNKGAEWTIKIVLNIENINNKQIVKSI